MNVMTGEMVAVVKMQSEAQWTEFFDRVTQALESTISGTLDSDLPALRAKVLQTKAIHQLFLQQRQRSN